MTYNSRKAARKPLTAGQWLMALSIATLALPFGGLAARRYIDFSEKLSADIASTSQAGILYTVDSTGDGGLVGSSNFCNDGTGKCTLRAAIQAANLHAGEDGIDISIPASDPNCV